MSVYVRLCQFNVSINLRLITAGSGVRFPPVPDLLICTAGHKCPGNALEGEFDMSDEASINLLRPSGGITRFWKFLVFIDAQEPAIIESGNNKLFKVTNGSHSIYIRAGFGLHPRSKLIKVDLLPGQNINLECGESKNYYLFVFFLVCLCAFLSYFFFFK